MHKVIPDSIWIPAQAKALVQRYPDDYELWARAWDWFKQQSQNGVPYEFLGACIEILEREWCDDQLLSSL